MLVRLFVLALAATALAEAGNIEPPERICSTGEPLQDAWWTGPMLAPSAATLPQGHFLIEPYLYDVTTQGAYSPNGSRHAVPHANEFGSLTYALYGLTDKLTIGSIPTFGYNTSSGAPSSAGIGFGDLTLQAQYRLTQFHECHWMPTISIAAQQAFPTGKYDQLGQRMNDGLGSGVYTTTLAIYSQMYFWLPNRRILRMRFNVLPSFSSSANVEGASVYGTSAAFRGHAQPGDSIFVDASWEYSVTRRWVLALDATYRYATSTRLDGYDTAQPDSPRIQTASGPSEAFGFAPAIEYSWNSNLGVLVGTRLIPAGRNTAATITPAFAINFVH